MATSVTESVVYDILCELLLSGGLPGGSKLGELDLADAFGVSRERIRKVLQRLGNERLIELIPNRGAFVADPSLGVAREIYDARRTLESGILLTLANTITTAQMTELDQHLQQERAAADKEDRVRMIQLSGAFHIKLAEMLGNEYITRYMQDLVSRTSMLVALFEQSAPPCSLHEHEEIVEALRRRDGVQAAKLGISHLALIETRLKARQQPAQEAVDPATQIKQKLADYEVSTQ